MSELTLLEKIDAINAELHRVFGADDTPFPMVVRLLEEAGELAAQINHFEDAGVKRVKHGEPDRMRLAKEVQDVIRCALQIAAYYDLRAELHASVDRSYGQIASGRLTTDFD